MATQQSLNESKTRQSFRRLIEGVDKFRATVYPELRESYERTIREGQKPHALFITCADSRIGPETLTQSKPGDIFVLRNIGNMIPAYGEMLGGVSAVIEYAVTALSVDQVVVCGHTECGAMKGLLNPDATAHMPTVRSWLTNGEAALRVAAAKSASKGKQLEMTELIEENVLLQLAHLRTHPSVAGRVADGSLLITGWVYDIARGTVRIFDEPERKFVSYQALLKKNTV
jgi:carbonic anhydrase